MSPVSAVAMTLPASAGCRERSEGRDERLCKALGCSHDAAGCHSAKSSETRLVSHERACEPRPGCTRGGSRRSCHSQNTRSRGTRRARTSARSASVLPNDMTTNRLRGRSTRRLNRPGDQRLAAEQGDVLARQRFRAAPCPDNGEHGPRGVIYRHDTRSGGTPSLSIRARMVSAWRRLVTTT